MDKKAIDKSLKEKGKTSKKSNLIMSINKCAFLYVLQFNIHFAHGKEK